MNTDSMIDEAVKDILKASLRRRAEEARENISEVLRSFETEDEDDTDADIFNFNAGPPEILEPDDDEYGSDDGDDDDEMEDSE